MIPKADKRVDLLHFNPQKVSSRAFNLGLTSLQRSRFIDEREAMKQAIFLILNTERYEYPIYPWSYGAELGDLIGQPIPYVLPGIKRRITEALEQDDRITRVDGWEFDVKRGRVTTSFLVHTIFGDIPIQKEVKI